MPHPRSPLPIRRMVRLSQGMDTFLVDRAARLHTDVSALVREAVAEYFLLPTERTIRTVERTEDTAVGVAV